MEKIHGPEENVVLELLEEVRPILANALVSLEGKDLRPEAHYLALTASTVDRAADTYLCLRRERKVASTLLVRPAIEALIYGRAAMKDRSFLFRKAYSEHLEDKKLF